MQNPDSPKATLYECRKCARMDNRFCPVHGFCVANCCPHRTEDERLIRESEIEHAENAFREAVAAYNKEVAGYSSFACDERALRAALKAEEDYYERINA